MGNEQRIPGTRASTAKTGPVSQSERASYFERHPSDAGRLMPPEHVARAMWELVAPLMKIGIDDLLPRRPYRDREVLELQQIRALTVLLATVVTDQTLAQRDIFDALALRLSREFQSAPGGARTAADMPLETVTAALHELRILELEPEKLMTIVQRGIRGIYQVTRPLEKYIVLRDGVEHERTARDYKVRVERGSEQWAAFIRILNIDRSWQKSKYQRVLFADEPIPEPQGSFEVAGGHRFKAVEPGPRALNAMRIATRSVLHLILNSFLPGVEGLDDADPDPRRDAQLKTLKSAYADVIAAIGAGRLDGSGHLATRTGYTQTINGRYEPTHLSPLGAANEHKSRRYLGENVWIESSVRDRWFSVDKVWGTGRVPLVGVDTVSSQWQILAILLGLTDLEQRLRHSSIKKLLADRALEKHADPNDAFALPRPERFAGAEGYRLLQDTMKFAATPLGYGSEFSEVAYRLRYDRDSPVFDRGRPHGLGTKANLERLFLDPTLGLRDIFKRYLPVCRNLAWTACARDEFAGFSFPTPLDPEVRRRWNPIQRWGTDNSWRETNRLRAQMQGSLVWLIAAKGDPRLPLMTLLLGLTAIALASTVAKREQKSRQHEKDRPSVKSGSIRIYVDLPKGRINELGDAEVDRDALADMIAPCIPHEIDGTLSALLMERFDKIGLPNFSEHHDAWMLPADATGGAYIDLLPWAIKDAVREWLPTWGVIYDAMIEVAEDPRHSDPTDAPWLRSIRTTWQGRVEAAQAGNEDAWPQLQMKPSGPLVKSVSPDGREWSYVFSDWELYSGQTIDELGTYMGEEAAS